MRNLWLIKHAQPEIVSGLPAKDWKLSAEGYRQSERLAERLVKPHSGPASAGTQRDAELEQVVASLEPKAYETGRILAQRLGIPFSSAPDLHEHRRESTEWIAERARWEALVKRFFDFPTELVFGEETADEAHSRFSQAVRAVMDQTRGNIAIAAHGTVISLLVARANGLDGFELWRRLGLPSAVLVEWPGLRLMRVLERV